MKWSPYAVLTCVALLVALGIVSCRSPVATEQEILFETDRVSYALGDTAILGVTNLGPAAVAGSVHCLLEVERKSGTGWEFASRPNTDRVCTHVSRLEPGVRDEREVPITSTYFSSAGEYRFTTTYFNESRTRKLEVTSNAFTVEQ